MNIQILGKENVNGLEFNKITGGFGDNERCILVKDIADIHETESWKINQSINRNADKFIYNVDIVDLKDTSFANNLCESEIFTQNAINASKNIYLLSQRGYLKLVKILEDAKAWEIYNILLNDYFTLKEKTSDPLSILESLNKQNQAALDAMKNINEKVQEQGNRIEVLETETIINSRKCRILSKKANSKVVEILGGKDSDKYKDSSLRSIVYQDLWGNYKDYIGVNSYTDTPKLEYESGLQFIENWSPSGRTLRKLNEI